MQHRTSLTRCRDCCRRRARGRARRHHAPNRPIALFHHGACRRVCTHAFQETGVVARASKEASAGSKRVRSCWASTEGGSRLRSYLARTTATRVDDPRAWMAAFKPCLGPTVCGGSLNVAGRSTQVHAAKPWEPRWLLSLFCLCCRPPHPACRNSSNSRKRRGRRRLQDSYMPARRLLLPSARSLAASWIEDALLPSERKSQCGVHCSEPTAMGGGALWICDGRVSPFVTRNRMRGQTPLSGRRG
jgi:hypothetical protein